MFLSAFIVAKHIDAVEIRFIHALLPVCTTLFQNHPASRLCFARAVFIGVVAVLVAVETLPGNKLTTRAIKDDVTRPGELDLLTVNPTRRRRRSTRRKPHLVPKFVCVFVLRRFFALATSSRRPLLRATRLWRDVRLDRF